MSTPESRPEPNQEKLISAIYSLAASLMMQGMPPAEIEDRLMQEGLDRETAAIIVQNLQTARANAHKAAGRKNMLFGALWCIGGTLVTIISYQVADNGGGGRYVVAWGAIVFGAIQFFRGLSQSASE